MSDPAGEFPGGSSGQLGYDPAYEAARAAFPWEFDRDLYMEVLNHGRYFLQMELFQDIRDRIQMQVGPIPACGAVIKRMQRFWTDLYPCGYP